MNSAISTSMPKQRTEFAAAGMRRRTQWVAGIASLAGARSSMNVIDPGGGPGS